MTPNPATMGILASGMLLVVAGGFAFKGIRADRKLADRLAGLHRTTDTVSVSPKPTGASLKQAALRFVSVVGDGVLSLGVMSGKTRASVETTLQSAGYTGGAALRIFIGAKILLLMCAPLAMWLLSQKLGVGPLARTIMIASGAVGGLVTPDTVVGKLREHHMNRIRNQLPDALDMMVICAGAGLGLGTTIVRVAQELQTTHRAIAVELAQTANEMRMMTDGRQPLLNFGDRCGVDSAKRLATTLLQSIQYGTPLTDALRGLAAELRTEMVTRFEEKAARLTVLLTFPMVVFILPALFLVVGGPAVIRVMHAFAH